MNTFILILVGLNLGVPVRCYEDKPAWRANKAEIQVVPNAVAYYNPIPEPYIALGPLVCRNVLKPNLDGAWVLAHELEHHAQWMERRPFNEEEADEVGYAKMYSLLRKLERFFGIKPRKPILPVTLASK